MLCRRARALAAAGLVAWTWRRDLPLPIRAASLISATLVAVPLALFYDLVLAGVAGAWLLRGEGEYRLPEWGKLVLAGLYVLSLNPRGMSATLHLPLGSLIALALAALVATIALRGKGVRHPHCWRTIGAAAAGRGIIVARNRQIVPKTHSPRRPAQAGVQATLTESVAPDTRFPGCVKTVPAIQNRRPRESGDPGQQAEIPGFPLARE